MKSVLLSKLMKSLLASLVLMVCLMLPQIALQAAPALQKTAPATATGAATSANNKAKVPDSVKPKPSLLPAVPTSHLFFAAPDPSSFEIVHSKAGKYQLQLPKSFGSSPLAAAEKMDDVALLRSNDQLLVATNVIDYSDALHYRATAALPDFQQAIPVLAWDQPSSSRQIWHCQLSRLHNYQDNLTILRAVSKVSGLTYEIIFLMPGKNYAAHLIEAFYTIDSFTL